MKRKRSGRRIAMVEEEIETVSAERLTRFYLLRHFLMRREKKQKLVDVVGAVCGLHAQLPLTPALSLWNRMEDFTPEALDDALYKERALVKTWFMRGTLHIIPSKDLSIYHKALKRMWFEHHGRYMNDPGWPSREEREKHLYPKIAETLSRKPLRRQELSEKVRSTLKGETKLYEWLFSSWGGILKETCYLGLTVHAEPCGRESCFARVDQWLPHVNLGEMDETKAREKLLLEYLGGYGPASIQDFACWSGIPASEARQTVETSSDALAEVQVRQSGKRLWMLKKDLNALCKIDVEEKTPLRLLPKFDSYLMGHKDRTRIIDDAHLKTVYRPVVGDIVATVLVNGRITGTWRHEKTKKTLKITVKPFKKYSKEVLAELKEAANELGAFMKVERTKTLIAK